MLTFDWAIRGLIADTIPGFKDFNTKLLHPGGFHLGNDAARRIWKTDTGKAQSVSSVLPAHLVSEGVRNLPA